MYTNKSKEEKKYVQLSPDTVIHLAESIGLSNISPNVARALAEDASYRCRELANLCSQLLRHGKRRKLTTQDVDRAMKWYNADPVYGHGAGSNEPGYSRIYDTTKPGNVTLFVNDEKLIDLRPYALTQSPAILASMSTIQGSWLSLEGTYLPENEEHKPVEYPPPSALTQQLMQYYSALLGVILGNSEQLLQVMLEDVQTNSKIGVLVPLLVTFIRNGIQRHCENQTLMRRLLYLLQALFSNPLLNLSPKPYLSHLVTALLSSLIIDRPNRDRNDFDCLSANVGHVQHASQILRQVLNRWATPVNQLRSQTHRALREYLKDSKISYSSHFGALAAMIALGPAVLNECLLPQMGQYLMSTVEKMQSLEVLPSGGAVENEMKKKVLSLMFGTILIAARSMLKQYIEGSDSLTTDEIREFVARYNMFKEYFGDSLCCTILPKYEGRYFINKQPPGRIYLRKLRPSRSNQIPADPVSFVKMETDDLLDYYSNSSRQDFNLLADMGVPSDIFEPEQQAHHHFMPRPMLQDTPEKISLQVKRVFDVRKNTTVIRYPRVVFNFGAPNWGPDRLRRKRLVAPRLAPGFKNCGAVGKRLVGIDQSTQLEYRQQFLFNNLYLDYIL